MDVLQHTDVLDHGFVELTGVLGSDLTILEWARVSTGSQSKGEAADRRLIKYLWDNKHTSPFESVEFSFRVKAPIFVIRQWQRHRVAEYNEFSGRYAEMPDEFYIPNDWRLQDTKNRQNSVGVSPNTKYWSGLLEQFCMAAYTNYQSAVADGIAKEQARLFLPPNIYTMMMFKMNAHALMHFLELRNDPHAQWEIRQYAGAMEEMFAAYLPYTYAAWRK